MEITQRNSSNIDQIENFQDHLKDFKDVIISTKERLNLCQTDINAIENLLRVIEEMKFDGKGFDQHDRVQIHLLALKQDLTEKSTRNDLIQMKISLDNQMKQILELSKDNARELDRIKLLTKTSTCQTRHIQSNLSVPSKPIRSHQISRPYITFELEQIRKYQRQALIQTPYGTIPLYRRQAWVIFT